MIFEDKLLLGMKFRQIKHTTNDKLATGWSRCQDFKHMPLAELCMRSHRSSRHQMIYTAAILELTYRQLRARRALLQIKDVPLRTRRGLLPLTLYSNSAFLVLNRTSLSCNNALLALNWWYICQQVPQLNVYTKSYDLCFLLFLTNIFWIFVYIRAMPSALVGWLLHGWLYFTGEEIENTQQQSLPFCLKLSDFISLTHSCFHIVKCFHCPTFVGGSCLTCFI